MLLDWVLSAGTLTMMWLAGNRNPWAWRIGLANQVLWTTFAVQKEAWGLLPLTAALVVVYARNLVKWSK